MDLIAGGYGRTSKEKDDGFSLDSQFAAIRNLADAVGISLPSEYELREEFSGRFLERPKLDVLRSLVRSGKIQAVIIYATDRLSRKLGVADLLLDELFAHNVRLYIVTWGTYVKDTPEDRLRFNFEATFSDFERRKIAERMHHGKQNKLNQGSYHGAGKAPFGYRKVGQKKEMRLEVNEEEAQIVRQIFTWYALKQLPMKEMLRRLHGTPTPSERTGHFVAKVRDPGDWADGTIYTILRNIAYTGKLHKWDTTITIPAIIDTELFQAAQERASQARPSMPKASGYEYLMGQRLRCAYCNYAISCHPHGGKDRRTVTLYYRCPSWRSKLVKEKCSLPFFKITLVDNEVWEWVRHLILHPESVTILLEESQREQWSQVQDLKARLAHLEERLETQEQRLTVVLREYAEIEARKDTNPAAAAIKEVYRQTKEQSEQIFNQLTEERASLQTALTHATIENSMQLELSTIAQAVRDDIDVLSFAGRRELIEALNVRGELAFEMGEQVLYIIWHNHRFRRVLSGK